MDLKDREKLRYYHRKLEQQERKWREVEKDERYRVNLERMMKEVPKK